jgi:nuclear pore complex protein Nup160
MDGGLLLATQLSCLFPSSQATSFLVQTLRRNTPLPPPLNESGPLAEHASFSSLLHTATTGTILLRVLHSGLILELVSLSTEHPPIRFVFPAPVLPSPGIFLWGTSEFHILAVTTTGSLYRLVVPTGGINQLWNDQLSGNWCREYLIKYVGGSVEGLVQVQGTHNVAIGFSNGSLLRLETEYLGDDTHHGAPATTNTRQSYETNNSEG